MVSNPNRGLAAILFALFITATAGAQAATLDTPDVVLDSVGFDISAGGFYEDADLELRINDDVVATTRGRSISAESHGYIRVMGMTMMIGQGAGAAPSAPAPFARPSSSSRRPIASSRAYRRRVVRSWMIWARPSTSTRRGLRLRRTTMPDASRPIPASAGRREEGPDGAPRARARRRAAPRTRPRRPRRTRTADK